ncbi:hypothetical protein LES9216_01362 [Leuconostoc suionicum]|jgi:hypothetical protein|uniref:Uncharacterized protein n=1 Tax=Leuconostoc suionicum TaxID=1511761 RepID=A0A2N9KA91_9LACO|nr:hypothetical protein LES8486_01215 [Leuconostoc suionicum]SPE07483.1 hypothetical protein LES9216_01362 [Leuconostoc suionicum]SPH03936.1 hypothetical protein LES8484_01215 [Leuconostoc suionicum]
MHGFIKNLIANSKTQFQGELKNYDFYSLT